MKKKHNKLLCLLLAVITVISLIPTSVMAATCTHSYTKKYSYENANMHSYVSVCSKCGTETTGYGYSGWEDHTFSTAGKCSKCGYSKVCSHTNTTKKYNNLSSTQHEYYTHCNGCGIDYYFTTENHSYSYGSWAKYSTTQHKRTGTCACGATKTEYQNHTMSNGKCTVCGYTSTTECSHSSTSKTYSSSSDTQHRTVTKCNSCSKQISSVLESHTFSGNTCTKCGYTKTATVTASVTLSASSSSGTLGSAGGEISAEGAPASYTVTATATGCTVTKIVYTKNGVSTTVNGSSVTITAKTDSDFTTTTFTAYTNVSGVTATFTVNHKVVKHTTSQVMWETSNTAVIRSITGNGMNKSLSYSMTIPTSYNGQSNLSADQVATIQSLIGVSDGKTYTVKYTRTITVYTPAQYSSTGARVNLGTFDGNDSSQISDCLSRWGWSSTTVEAIRQAASSSLTFTTGIATNCTAKWINTDTNQQLYSTSFGTGTVSASSSKTVSVSYSDYSGSGNYVFENLSYSGDTSGTSTNQSFSTTYTVTSKPLTVTFYCHPTSSTTETDDDLGDITVYVRDRDTNELLSGATVSGAGKKGTTNTSGGVIFRDLTYGTYSFSVTKSGYVSNSGSATISSSVPSKSITIYLSKIVYDDDEDDDDYDYYGDITIYVRDSETNAVISSASVYGRGTTKYTSTSGYVTFYDVPYGSYSFSASRSGYESNSTYVTTSSSYPNRTATIYLTPEEEYYDDEDETGDITVYVRNADTEELIEGATVSGCGLTKTTSEYGYTVFYDLSFGSYPITASMDGYESESVSVTLSSTSGKTATIYLTPKEKPTKGSIKVYVRDNSTNNLIYNASVVKDGTTYSTYSTGSITFTNLDFGTYTLKASKTDYETRTTSVTISADEPDKTVTIYLYHIDYSATSGQITLYVKDAVTKEPIINAEVYGLEQSRYTSYSGAVYYYDVEFGIHYFTAYADGYYYDATYVSIYQSSSHGEATIYLYPEEPTGTATVYVRDSNDKSYISGAKVMGFGYSGKTDSSGKATFYDVSYGEHCVSAEKDGYEYKETVANISEENSNISVTIYLDKKIEPVSIYVRDSETTELLASSNVDFDGLKYSANSSGVITVRPKHNGEYTITANSVGHVSKTETFTYSGEAKTVNVYLDKYHPKGSITVMIFDRATFKSIPNSVTVFQGKEYEGISDGYFVIDDLDVGNYYVKGTAAGYEPCGAYLDITETALHPSIALYLDKAKPTTGSILIYVLDYDTHEVIDGAKVKYEGVDYSLDSNGSRLFSDLAFDNHVFVGSAPGYESYGYMDFLNETRLEITHTIYLHKNKSDVSITANDVNGTVYRGSTIMVAATVHGDSAMDFTPDNPLTVTMKATKNGSTVFDTQTASVICPKGESNLVWFAVKIPESGYASDSITFSFEVAAPAGVTESTPEDNKSTKSVTPVVLPARSTPKPSLELTKPKDFSVTSYKTQTAPSRSWTVWEWNSGFVKKTYSAKLTTTASVSPDSTAVWKKQNSVTKQWTTRSGYGLTTSVSVSCTGLKSGMLAGNAKVNAYYPEYNYSVAAGKSNMLLRTTENTAGYSASYSFAADSNNLNNAKMHKSPVWFPDGEYSVKYEVYDLWTPAGMLTGTTYAIVNIEGSLYDDYYTNRS